MHAVLRLNFDQQVDMIRHHLQFDYCSAIFLGSVEDDPIQSFVYVVHQHERRYFGRQTA
jgi:hypothetical protein